MEDMAAPKSAGRKILLSNTFIEFFLFFSSFFFFFNSRVNVYLHLARPVCPLIWLFPRYHTDIFDRTHHVSKYSSIEIVENSDW